MYEFWSILTLKWLQLDSNWQPVWVNGWVFVYELGGCGFESSCSHVNFRFCACFEQGVPWHLENNRVWIHSEICMWNDKDINLNTKIRLLFQSCPNICECFHFFRTKVENFLQFSNDTSLTILVISPYHIVNMAC